MRYAPTVLVLCAVAVAGCTDRQPPRVPAAPAAPRLLQIDQALQDSSVPARWARGQLTAAVLVWGRARSGQQLQVSGGCRLAGCRQWVTAAADGRWQAALVVSAPPRQRRVRILVRDALGSGEQQTAPVALRAEPSSAPRAQPAPPRPRPQPPQPPPHAERPPAAASPAPGRPRILVIGDSLQLFTGQHLPGLLPGTRVDVHAYPGFSSPLLLRELRRRWLPAYQAVLFDAGTNDDPHYPRLVLRPKLQAVARLVGRRCLVVPTVHGLSVGGVDSSGKNQVIRAFARSRPGTLTPDWAQLATTRPELMQADGIHPSDRGGRVRARLLAAALRACLGR